MFAKRFCFILKFDEACLAQHFEFDSSAFLVRRMHVPKMLKWGCTGGCRCIPITNMGNERPCWATVSQPSQIESIDVGDGLIGHVDCGILLWPAHCWSTYCVLMSLPAQLRHVRLVDVQFHCHCHMIGVYACTWLYKWCMDTGLCHATFTYYSDCRSL